ncbi:hypothetical protein SZ63_07640 [Methanoculleus sediminis]|uniref:Uncharacterized protein n=1 Tax=Methanoculleus sediminis TaxID=1550566 RepID=A0A0H1QYM2_9EURY|nr:hypothetical protein SZ63_07640 [Methanoculleus sediminis]
MSEAGTLACTAAGGLVVDVEGERYRIEAGDVKSLIFSGRPAQVVRERHEGGTGLTIEGYAAVNPAGRAVVIRVRAGAWIVPLVSFRRVACGEAVSAPLSPSCGAVQCAVKFTGRSRSSPAADT